MNRPWTIWIVFGVSFVVLLAAMTWVSLTTLRLDRAQVEGARQEENVRLALWRMESSLTPLIAEESARPYSAFYSFHAAEPALTRDGAVVRRDDALTASPLLSRSSSNVFLHFQFWPSGLLTSPQLPTGADRSLAESGYTTRQQIEAAAVSLGRLQGILNARADAAAVATISVAMPPASPALVRNRDVLINQCASFRTSTVEQVIAPGLMPFRQPRNSDIGQQALNSAEWNARANYSQQVSQQAFANNILLNPSNGAFAQPTSEEGPLRALWLGDELFLARRVNLEGRFVVQGCWLNWTNLKQSLLANVKDLFPAADLQPAPEPATGRRARLLAGLPVNLVPGAMALPPLASPSALRVSIAVAWLCVLLAGVAVAILMHGAVSLSQRRGAFVSAVTHELRTPLTTFKMYSEMLAEGMVADGTKKKQYLHTLCSEANRLSHLVENVLAYARLERGSARDRVQRLALGDLLTRVKARLMQRAEQAGMALVEDATEQTLKTIVHVDVSAVEQILFNLVDNACKYATAPAHERLIHLEALAEGKYAMLRVRDHGQGISAEGAKRLFRPFNKSANEAADTAPGVGLGLALCRRLSRSLGGELRLDAAVKTGACFELRLPLVTRESAGAL